MALSLAAILGTAATSSASEAGMWKVTGGAGKNAGDKKELTSGTSASQAPPACVMLFCPGGEFPFGLTDADTKKLGSFWIGETEVTCALWFAVSKWATGHGYAFQNSGATPGKDTLPVSSVSWRDAVVWSNALSEMTGLKPVYVDGKGQVIRDARNANGKTCDQAVNSKGNGFRLPSSWEWECAARWQGSKNGTGMKKEGGLYWSKGEAPAGGTTDDGAFGDFVARGKITAVKSKKPNGLGCYDLNGNVAEWCFGTGSAQSLIRVLRGGAWYQNNNYLQSGCVQGFFADSAGTGTGFRLAQSEGSLGTDYVFSGGEVADPVPAPERPVTNARVSTKIRWQNQKDACLEYPDAFPICRENIGFIQLESVQEDIFAAKDPALGVAMERKNELFYNLFQSGAQIFETFATGRTSPGMSEKYVENCIKAMKEDEATGKKVFGFWTFREDAFIFPHIDAKGNFDAAFYGKHLPPFPDVDPRFPSLEDIKNWRTAMAASDLKCKSTYKMILLLRENTMLKLLHPERMKGVVDHWSKPLPGLNAPMPSPQRAAEILAYIRDNFDGVGEELHIGFHRPGRDGPNKNPESMAACAKWCADNQKIAFMFLGGGEATLDKKGLTYAKESYEYLFKLLQAEGVRPNDPSIIYFRQGGFQGIQQVPEEIHNPTSPTVFSEVAWLDRRLSGPVINNEPELQVAPGQSWSFQPVAATFGRDALTWSLAHAPNGMSVNAKTGQVQWTPPASLTTSGKVVLSVSDGKERDDLPFEIQVGKIDAKPEKTKGKSGR